MTRAIVRDPDILFGRWRLDQTTMPVALIRDDGNRMGRDDTMRAYGFMDLTDDEYSAVMAFDFPEVRDLNIGLVYASVLVNCVCGEDTPWLAKGSLADVHCICGRNWDVQIGVQGVTQQA